jgi:NAD+ synthase (glutamine-hydrolysing)
LNSSIKSIHIKKTKYEEIVNALLFEQKEFFRLCKIEKAQVHVSGGLDSAIVAALVAKAMGKENTILITNPSSLNSKSLKYVEHIEKKLGIKVYTDPVQSIVDEFLKVHNTSFDSDLSLTGQASVHAVLRTVQGIAASHQFGSGIVATGNHTEIVLGWASFHDIGSIGVHSLIGDLTKIELYQLADYINKQIYKDEVIPKDQGYVLFLFVTGKAKKI